MTFPPKPGSSSEPGLSECFARATALLDELGLRWALAGAYAALVYRAETRLTTDVDLLVEWHDQLPDRLTAAGFDLRVMRDGDDVHLIRASRLEGMVDLIVAGTEYQREAIARARDHVLTAEDVIVHKLIAWRPRDRDDIRSILAAEISLDHSYLAHWAGEWDVADRWREAQGWVAD